MAVIVQCFQCNAILELDDGFRGGVCRCSTCGALLQVPQGESDGMMPPRPKVRPPKPMPHVAAAATANGTRVADAGLSSGQLDPRRADIGASSGLGRIHPTQPIAHTSSRRRTESNGVPQQVPIAREQRNNRWLFWLGMVLAVLIIGLAIIWGGYYLFSV
jgi:hypothetical protein